VEAALTTAETAAAQRVDYQTDPAHYQHWQL